jgi:signal transduction histidine kinase
MRRVGWLVAGTVGVLIGAGSAVIANRDPGYAFAGSGARIAIELIVGYAAIACGLACLRRRASRQFGSLLVAAGAAWFLVEWNNPGVGSSLVFTVGLVLYAAAAPLVAHALLVYVGTPLRRPERAVLAAAYGASVLVLGLLPALVFDPAAQGCSQCPNNLLLVHGSARAYRDVSRVGVYVGLGWTLAAVALIGWRLARSSVALRRAIAPALAAGSLYLALAAVDFGVSLGRGYLSNATPDQWLWLAQAAALALLVLALIWTWLRGRRTRASLARLVVELAGAPSPGQLEQALAGALGDPGLRLAYPRSGGSYIDANGRRLDPAPGSTQLVRDGVEVALLSHRAGLFDEPGLVEEVAATARLALEHERLRAELLSQLEDLRASRARIVAAGDAERRRLERDLHDGAQQRLIAVGLDLRLAQIRLDSDPNPDRKLIDCVERADAELTAALAELRELAGGIFPAVLADEGLAAAVEALAEEAVGQLRITGLPDGRLDLAVETAAYRVAQTLEQAGTAPVSVAASVRDGLLVLELTSRQPPVELSELKDRLGALDGTLAVGWVDDADALFHAEIPCGS